MTLYKSTVLLDNKVHPDPNWSRSPEKPRKYTRKVNILELSRKQTSPVFPRNIHKSFCIGVYFLNRSLYPSKYVYRLGLVHNPSNYQSEVMQKTKETQFKELKKELIELKDKDQEMIRDGRYSFDEHVKLTKRIKEIINQYGFPTISMVGKDGSQAAWLLVQHADENLTFQKRVLKLMLEADKKNDVNKDNLAYLIDRVRVNSGKPQIYGTQYKEENGKIVSKPIEDEKNVDKRRKSVGLQPLSVYISEANESLLEKSK